MKKKVTLNESTLNKIIMESFKKLLKEGYFEVPDIDDAYNNLMHAISEFEDSCGERSEEGSFSTGSGWDDREMDPSNFFLPSNDIAQLKAIAKKIREDYNKSQTRSIGRYKRDENNKLFRKG